MTMQPDRKRGWGFWFKWVFANAVAFTVAYALAIDIANAIVQFLSAIHVMYISFEVPSTIIFGGMVFGAINGILIGAVQSFVFHQNFRQAGRWAAATGLGASLTAGINNFGAITAQTTFPMFMPGIVLGIFVGAAQWVILRQRFSDSEWWILASAICLGIITVVSFWLDPHLTESLAHGRNGIIYGSITGLVLVHLYNHPKQQFAESTQPSM